ncbi:MAG: hypothetical protein ABIF82_12105 [Planctomycetota bacterium]
MTCIADLPRACKQETVAAARRPPLCGGATGLHALAAWRRIMRVEEWKAEPTQGDDAERVTAQRRSSGSR